MIDYHFNKVAIIGVGLIGASLALAIRREGLAGSISGSGRSEENLRNALEKGIIDSYSFNYSETVTDADLIVLATPVGQFRRILQDVHSSLRKGAIVTDVGSVKGGIVRDLEGMVPEGTYFVGGHPIAGSDRSGIDHAKEDLFKGERCILTPTENTSKQSLDSLKSLWEAVGAHVSLLSPEEHDLIFGLMSHFPHLVAYALVNTVGSLNPDYIEYSGQGFKDTTRIALSSPELWSDICILNGKKILASMEIFRNSLSELEEKLKVNDAEGLEKLLHEARNLRGRINNDGK
jgi:prephenate dehydrogenase